jgi:hypothetical protein
MISSNKTKTLGVTICGFEMKYLAIIMCLGTGALLYYSLHLDAISFTFEGLGGYLTA